jgi:hypothetical protein
MVNPRTESRRVNAKVCFDGRRNKIADVGASSPPSALPGISPTGGENICGTLIAPNRPTIARHSAFNFG